MRNYLLIFDPEVWSLKLNPTGPHRYGGLRLANGVHLYMSAQMDVFVKHSSAHKGRAELLIYCIRVDITGGQRTLLGDHIAILNECTC